MGLSDVTGPDGTMTHRISDSDTSLAALKGDAPSANMSGCSALNDFLFPAFPDSTTKMTTANPDRARPSIGNQLAE